VLPVGRHYGEHSERVQCRWQADPPGDADGRRECDEIRKRQHAREREPAGAPDRILPPGQIQSRRRIGARGRQQVLVCCRPALGMPRSHYRPAATAAGDRLTVLPASWRATVVAACSEPYTKRMTGPMVGATAGPMTYRPGMEVW
jgi:hypothetical protein